MVRTLTAKLRSQIEGTLSPRWSMQHVPMERSSHFRRVVESPADPQNVSRTRAPWNVRQKVSRDRRAKPKQKLKGTEPRWDETRRIRAWFHRVDRSLDARGPIGTVLVRALWHVRWWFSSVGANSTEARRDLNWPRSENRRVGRKSGIGDRWHRCGLGRGTDARMQPPPPSSSSSLSLCQRESERASEQRRIRAVAWLGSDWAELTEGFRCAFTLRAFLSFPFLSFTFPSPRVPSRSRAFTSRAVHSVNRDSVDSNVARRSELFLWPFPFFFFFFFFFSQCTKIAARHATTETISTPIVAWLSCCDYAADPTGRVKAGTIEFFAGLVAEIELFRNY